MNEFKECIKALISLILDYIGTFTLLFLMAGYIDEEVTDFSFIIIFVVSFFVAFWLVPAKEKTIKVEDTEDDDYYNDMGL